MDRRTGPLKGIFEAYRRNHGRTAARGTELARIEKESKWLLIFFIISALVFALTIIIWPVSIF